MRDRKAGFDITIPLGYEDLVLEVFGHRCAACGSTEDLELDHHQPLRLGYPLLHNAVPLCAGCNGRKHVLPPQFFYSSEQLNKVDNLLLRVRELFEERLLGHVKVTDRRRSKWQR